jgi:hypothetical protein
MSIGVVSIYGKILLAILQMRLYSLSVFSMHAKILLAYSEMFGTDPDRNGVVEETPRS